MNLNTLEAALPATMTTDDLLTESEDLVTSIRNAGDSPQDTEIDRLADLLAELASQRSFVNHNGRTLLAAEKEKMVDWYDILTEGSKRFRPKEVMPDTITAPSNAVVQQVSAVIPQDMWLHSKRKPIRQKNQPAGLVDIPKKVTIKPTKKKTDSPQQFTEPVAPYVPRQDKVEVEEEVFVPELRTKRQLLQDCEDSVVHFAEDNRTIVLHRTKLITSILDLFSQYDFDVRQHEKTRMYYNILEKKQNQRLYFQKKNFLYKKWNWQRNGKLLRMS